jgi:hypothetical protein
VKQIPILGATRRRRDSNSGGFRGVKGKGLGLGGLGGLGVGGWDENYRAVSISGHNPGIVQ